MNTNRPTILRTMAGAPLVGLILIGGLLLFPTFHIKEFNPSQIAWDLQWLNAWSLGCLAVGAIIWLSDRSVKTRVFLSILCISLWGLVGVALLFDGTPFTEGSFWGDQQFRTAMVLKFKTFLIPTDMYLKGLPSFYPPAYYYGLSLIARIFSIEAYKMLKIGNLLMFSIGPVLLFWIWRKSVSGFQALCAVAVTFLIQPALAFGAPHEFLANAFFVPWWLHYVEGIRANRRTFRHIFIGGLIGSLIFMTYYYAFLLGGLLVLARLTSGAVSSRWRQTLGSVWFRTGWRVAAANATFSVVYWLPLILSAMACGFTSGQNRWFNMGYAAMTFPFLEFSIAGMLILSGVFFAAYRMKTRVYRVLLEFVLAVPIFYGVGYVLGNLDTPVLYIKAREFLWPAAGPLIGLPFALVWRRYRQSRLAPVLAVAATLFILFEMNEFSQLLTEQSYVDGRKGAPMQRYVDMAAKPENNGAVYLTDAYECTTFMPVYLFVSPGEHIANPAGRFFERTCWLGLLQDVTDPYLFAVALRHNNFDRVDYLMPRLNGTRFELAYTLSAYPDRLYAKSLSYDAQTLDDTACFVRQGNSNVFGVRDVIPPTAAGRSVRGSIRDSLIALARLRLVRADLNSVGKDLMDRYIGVDWSRWMTLSRPGEKQSLGATVKLLSIEVAKLGDSAFLAFEFRALTDFTDDFKIFLHIYPPGQASQFVNYDFRPQRPTREWRKGDVIVCLQAVPSTLGELRIHIGLFSGDQRLGPGWWSRLESIP